MNFIRHVGYHSGAGGSDTPEKERAPAGSGAIRKVKDGAEAADTRKRVAPHRAEPITGRCSGAATGLLLAAAGQGVPGALTVLVGKSKSLSHVGD